MVVAKLVNDFFLSSLHSLNKEAAIKQIQDFKQLRNEKKMLEKEFKKTQVGDDAVYARAGSLASGVLGLLCEQRVPPWRSRGRGPGGNRPHQVPRPLGLGGRAPLPVPALLVFCFPRKGLTNFLNRETKRVSVQWMLT